MQYVKHHKRLAALLVLLVCAMFSLAMTNFPDGVASYGIPLPAGDYVTSGKYLFVDNTSTSAQNSYPLYGSSWEKPLRTINYAIGKCGTNTGDIIFVSPRHRESLTAETTLALSKAGVRVVGLGSGRNRPTLTWVSGTSTAALPSEAIKIVVSADNTALEGFVLDMAGGTGVSGFHTGVSVSSTVTGFTLRNNTIIVSKDSGSKVGNAVYLSGGTNSVIRGNAFYGSGLAANAVTSVVYVGPRVDNLTFSDNTYAAYVSTTAYADGGIIKGAGWVTGFVINSDSFKNYNAGGSPFWFGLSTSATTATFQGFARDVFSAGGLGGVTTINQPVEGYRVN